MTTVNCEMSICKHCIDGKCSLDEVFMVNDWHSICDSMEKESHQ